MYGNLGILRTLLVTLKLGLMSKLKHSLWNYLEKAEQWLAFGRASHGVLMRKWWIDYMTIWGAFFMTTTKWFSMKLAHQDEGWTSPHFGWGQAKWDWHEKENQLDEERGKVHVFCGLDLPCHLLDCSNHPMCFAVLGSPNLHRRPNCDPRKKWVPCSHFLCWDQQHQVWSPPGQFVGFFKKMAAIIFTQLLAPTWWT